MTKDQAIELIMKWKTFWMNQTQNSEEDRQNYFSRAMAVDANMKHHLASLISVASECQVADLTFEIERLRVKCARQSAELIEKQEEIERLRKALEK